MERTLSNLPSGEQKIFWNHLFNVCEMKRSQIKSAEKNILFHVVSKRLEDFFMDLSFDTMKDDEGFSMECSDKAKFFHSIRLSGSMETWEDSLHECGLNSLEIDDSDLAIMDAFDCEDNEYLISEIQKLQEE